MKGKIGIVCDNYKVEMFEQKLREAGLVFTKTPFVKGSTTIKVFTTDKQKVAAICENVEASFKN